MVRAFRKNARDNFHQYYDRSRFYWVDNTRQKCVRAYYTSEDFKLSKNVIPLKKYNFNPAIYTQNEAIFYYMIFNTASDSKNDQLCCLRY